MSVRGFLVYRERYKLKFPLLPEIPLQFGGFFHFIPLRIFSQIKMTIDNIRQYVIVIYLHGKTMLIESLVPVNNHPHIVARFNLRLTQGLIIRDIRYMKSLKGTWIAWPSRAYKDKEGKDKYFDYITFDKACREAVEKEIKDKVEALLQPQNPTNDITQVPF